MQPRHLSAVEATSLETSFVAARQMRPYYARALAALQPLAVDGLGTIAIGADYRLYVDMVWFDAMPLTQRAALLAQHEIEHVLRDHCGRTRRLQPEWRQDWLVATDAEINDDSEPGDLPSDGCWPRKLGQPDGLLAEEYYVAMVEPASVRGTCGGGSGAGVPIEGELPPEGGVSEAEGDSLRDQVASDVRDYLVTHGRGSVPLGLQMWAEERARRVVIPWARELRGLISRTCREISSGRQDWSWSHPSRRVSPILRPGLVGFRPVIGLVVDTSGSMAERGELVLSVVRSAARTLGTLRVWHVDAEISVRGKRHRRGDRYHGGGGTDLRPAMIEASVASDLVVTITDCDTPWPETLPCRSIVVTHVGATSSPSWARRLEVVTS